VSPGGVPKRAVHEATVTKAGIIGDAWGKHFHGGPHQALLLITAEGIAELLDQGYALFPGALGENLTTRGLDRRVLRAKQRYRAGEVILELTTLRWPCETLAVYGPGIQSAICDAEARAGEASASARWGLSGFYASVVQEGKLRPGDAIDLIDA
jgi:MOSC domain-containing protein YiiM